MAKRLVFLAMLTASVSMQSYPQGSLTLKDCYDFAAKKSPIGNESDLYNSIWLLRDRNLKLGWLPELDAGATLLYNSDVVDMSEAFSAIPVPGITDAVPLMPHEQYRITLDINQMIYDGGYVRKARIAQEADRKVNQQQSQTDLYKLRSQVSGYYFSILLIDRQTELLGSFIEVIEKRLLSMNSALANGVILRSDIDVMLSEKIRIEQQITESGLKKASLMRVLSDLTGIQIGTETSLILPSVENNAAKEIYRPELKVFDLKSEQLDAGMNLLDSKRMPRAFGFATLGYGKPPGNDFFNDSFSPYYIIGAGIKWNIYDWNRIRNEKEQIRLQKNLIEARKEDLGDNLKRSLELKEAEIKALESALERDSELISLRKRITSSAESGYENGTITATELLNEMNSERQALINLEIHRITLIMARVEYLNISGIEIE